MMNPATNPPGLLQATPANDPEWIHIVGRTITYYVENGQRPGTHMLNRLARYNGEKRGTADDQKQWEANDAWIMYNLEYWNKMA